MIQPTDRLDVNLEAQQWDNIMRVLSGGPYNVVAPLIAEIQRQCQTHETRQRSTNPPPRLVPEDYAPIADNAGD
jgi:hypothetical protein